ncbi:hypothetical protein VHAB30_44260 [Variovorax boronicumulans]|nr:hypothetical protein VHAB30_44260 [Variovorax boronicumulans]
MGAQSFDLRSALSTGPLANSALNQPSWLWSPIRQNQNTTQVTIGLNKVARAPHAAWTFIVQKKWPFARFAVEKCFAHEWVMIPLIKN